MLSFSLRLHREEKTEAIKHHVSELLDEPDTQVSTLELEKGKQLW